MTTRENKVRQCELDVEKQAARVLEARQMLEHGTIQARAEYDRELAKLGAELRQQELALEKEKAWLKLAQAELERGFEA